MKNLLKISLLVLALSLVSVSCTVESLEEEQTSNITMQTDPPNQDSNKSGNNDPND